MVYSKYQCSFAFYWSLTYARIGFLFRIAYGLLLGKSCPFGFSFVFECLRRVPFPVGVWGRMWNSIVPVPDHCLFFYVTLYLTCIKH